MVEKIKKLCKEQGIAISKLEKELHFARGYIYKLNSSTPSIANAQKIASYLGVDIRDLIS